MAARVLTALRPGAFLSASTNAHVNLAFEELLCHELAASGEPALMVWRNEPTVVIGRTQNPWSVTMLRLPRVI